MKTNTLRFSLLLAGLALSTPAFANVNADAGYVDLGKFSAADGCEYVEINLKSGLLKFAAKIAAAHEPEVADLLRNIKMVRVNVVGMDDSNRADTTNRVVAMRADLETQGWEKIVTVREAGDKGGDDVAIYVMADGEEAISGLVVTVLEKNGKAVVVNVVGNIRADQIAQLGEKFDIKPLREIKVKVDAETGA
ncbi:MAG: DUF4252 domain-containing protein [Cephaloticoccus sp.]|nr:DUF4252 domain-containing protein [Cephaloticoccus sp.]MCF7759887.1 DUF4252 domain-containing protein [Cephaloticoccus sp.]